MWTFRQYKYVIWKNFQEKIFKSALCRIHSQRSSALILSSSFFRIFSASSSSLTKSFVLSSISRLYSGCVSEKPVIKGKSPEMQSRVQGGDFLVGFWLKNTTVPWRNVRADNSSKRTEVVFFRSSCHSRLGRNRVQGRLLLLGFRAKP